MNKYVNSSNTGQAGSVGDATPKEEEIREEFRKQFDELKLKPPKGSIKNLERELILDYWLKIRRGAIAERDEEIKKMVEKIDDSGGGSGRRLKLQILGYLTQE